MVDTEDDVSVQHVAELTVHIGSVNVVRFDPERRVLGSGADDGKIILWRLKKGIPDTPAPAPGVGGNLVGEVSASEVWSMQNMLSGHAGDVYDISWAAGGSILVSGSVDNKALVWDVTKSNPPHTTYSNHSHYVQGVTFDPHGEFFVTQSADQSCRVYTAKPNSGSIPLDTENPPAKFVLPTYEYSSMVKHIAHDAEPEGSGEDETSGARRKRYVMFRGEDAGSFFRRLDTSPDGALVVVPTGVYVNPGEKKTRLNTTYVFARHSLDTPIYHLPSADEVSVAVRFCPLLYTLNESDEPPLVNVGYRMIFAVASTDSVTVYDTQSSTPLALITNLHCSSITDLAWSPSGTYLALSSNDCYVSLVKWEEGELGTPLPLDQYPPRLQSLNSSLTPFVYPTVANPGVGVGPSSGAVNTLVARKSTTSGDVPVFNTLVARKKKKPTSSASSSSASSSASSSTSSTTSSTSTTTPSAKRSAEAPLPSSSPTKKSKPL